MIDALSCGTAVIGTSIAFEGIEDNERHKLLHYAHSEKEYIETIKNWKNVCLTEKQDGADEFYSRYNKNHFTDALLLGF